MKINREYNNEMIQTSFEFSIKHPYIIYREGGDINNNINGNLIIKLNLPENYIWGDNNIIYYNYNITLYEYIYGISNIFEIENKKITIKDWTPYRDGIFIDTNYKIIEYNIIIKLNLSKNLIDKNKDILKEYFN